MVGLAKEVPSSVISELRSWVQFMVGLAEGGRLALLTQQVAISGWYDNL
jgi:hypothetical protein